MVAGYEYAAATLLRAKDRGVAAIHLETESDGAFDFSPFDQGIQLALSDWHNLLRSLGGAIVTSHTNINYSLHMRETDHEH